jgi:hypothetical protein
MVRSSDWRAWRSADLFGNSHRDRAFASPGVPPTAASDSRTAAINRPLGGSNVVWSGIAISRLLVTNHSTSSSTALVRRSMARTNGYQKRGIRTSRRWRKLRLDVDADTHEVVAVELTPDDVGDVSELVDLLDQVATGVTSVTADGAYDGEPVYDAVTDRHPEADIIIPRRATAVPSTSGATQRDQHVATIRKHGRIGWQRRSGYSRRSLVETACIGTKPSLDGDSAPGLCPVSRSKQRLDATC